MTTHRRTFGTLIALFACAALISACEGGTTDSATAPGTSGASNGGTGSGGSSSGATTKLTLGQVCSGPLQCQSGACGNGVCIDPQTKLEVGAACKGAGECISGLCQDGKCAQGAGTATVGQPCKADSQCATGACGNGKCIKTCQTAKDCLGGLQCTQQGDFFACGKPTYNPKLGQSCAAHGKCPDGLKCSLPAEAVEAVCTATCATDANCPPHLACTARFGGEKVCMPRQFCSECMADIQCGEGATCTPMGAGKFCSKTCTPGKTECPRYADCKDIGDGNFQCVHRAGACAVKEPTLCSPCTGDSTCKTGASCLSWPYTGERFCGGQCSGDSDCGSGYKCYKVGANSKQCGPAQTKLPIGGGKSLPLMSCINKITPQYEKGDIMEDFAMVGVIDIDGDGEIVDEQPRVLRLSDFEAHSVIFLTVAAGWCSACQKETLDFKNLYKKYGGQLVIFQILYQGFSQKSNDYATFAVLNKWNNALKPIGGAVGVDFTRRIRPVNTGASTPLSMLIDAKSRLILDKWNGYSHYNLVAKLNALPHLKKK